MQTVDRNRKDSKGFFPVHLTILKAISNELFIDLSKKIMHYPDINLDIKGPTGWNPLQ